MMLNPIPLSVRALLPELTLILLTAVLIVISLIKSPKLNEALGWITSLGFLLSAAIAFGFSIPSTEPFLLFGGMLRFDQAGFLFRLLFLIAGALTSILTMTDENISTKPEYYLMLVFSAFGMCFMASSSDLIMLFLAIETASIPLYVMAGLKVRDDKSVEAGIKYFLFGAMSSAVMLYGFSLLYGFSGTTNLYDISNAINAGSVPLAAVILAISLVMAGFTFKVSVVPFHFWAPDVYEGAPTPVAGFLSTASKIAGFAALLRILLSIFNTINPEVWRTMLAVMALATMFIGNLIAIQQKNIKRLIAYSSIAQAGYVLVGIASGINDGYAGAVYYLMAYLVTNLAVFGIIGWVGRSTGSDEISSYAGLHRRSPGLAIAMLIGLLSLGGIPPFAGFIAKLLVFGAAIQTGMLWLALAGILNSVIALYYYLRILKVIYVDPSSPNWVASKRSPLWTMALVICIAGVVILGFVFTPWFQSAVNAVASIK